MGITCDWHIHSDNSCDEACLRVADLIVAARTRGILDYGLTDHLHTPFNLPDIESSRAEYLSESPPPRFHFGIEVSVVSQWEIEEIAAGKHEAPVYGLRSGGPPGAPLAIALTQRDIGKYGIEYVVGGTHWPMYVPFEREAIIRDYHRQNMFLACHPLVDIVAHPWWWHGRWQDPDGAYRADPWLDDFGRIPKSMHDEFAAAAVRHGTAVEVNVCAMLLTQHYPEGFKRQYLDYLAELKSRGVRLSIGSDCHDPVYGIPFEKAERMLDTVGIGDADFWRLPPRAGA